MNLDTSRTPVGIDLAKDSFAAAVGDGRTEVVRAFPLTREGLVDLLRFLEPYGTFPDAFVFGLEASGPYTEPLLSWLVQRNARVYQLNPLLISRYPPCTVSASHQDRCHRCAHHPPLHGAAAPFYPTLRTAR